MNEQKEEKPFDLVNIRIYRKTRKLLKRLAVERGVSMVQALHIAVTGSIDDLNTYYDGLGATVPYRIPKD